MKREGIWVVTKISRKGSHAQFMSEKLEDLPKIRLRAEVEPYRENMTKALKKYLDNHKIEDKVLCYSNIRIKEILDIIFNQIKEK